MSWVTTYKKKKNSAVCTSQVPVTGSKQFIIPNVGAARDNSHCAV